MSRQPPSTAPDPGDADGTGAQVRRFTDDTSWQDLAGYARAVRSGDLVVVSGTTSSGPDGEPVYPGDVYAQTLDAAQRGVRAVQALGGAVTDVIRTRVYLVPGASWRDAARAHKEVFDAARPANTTLHVASLIGEGLLVEVEVEARVTGTGASG